MGNFRKFTIEITNINIYRLLNSACLGNFITDGDAIAPSVGVGVAIAQFSS
ncbi:hypothetical protein [Nostoc sp. UHCC 0251]|uniref:hypothetical protein n=1 Tax=Nostoc sp. UHCC 0251 TaxID=3110240 RepID=UPI002B2079E7|nr:hypothetical protein [Nostoc sp. UHCC 0251]MEA5624310.1 hypothetical protein [Nostoc sp. UHCC 0251]